MEKKKKPGEEFHGESSRQNYEWHRERILREKRNPNAYTANRNDFNLREIQAKHGDKAAKEMVKEYRSRERNKKRMYFT